MSDADLWGLIDWQRSRLGSHRQAEFGYCSPEVARVEKDLFAASRATLVACERSEAQRERGGISGLCSGGNERAEGTDLAVTVRSENGGKATEEPTESDRVG
jgi:hypothetical protein